MEFYEKLKALRKDHGMSQEEFADALSVSRQAVSKWENGQGYPETEKLLQISTLFGVSLDYLLKSSDDTEPANTGDEPGYYASREAVEGFLACKQKGAHQIGLGVAIIISSLIFEELFGESVGTVLFLVGVAIGVALLIAQAFRPKRYEEMEKQPLVMDPAFLREFRAQYQTQRARYGMMIVAGVALYIVSFIIVMIFEEILTSVPSESAEVFPPLLWAAGVYLFITAGSALGAMKVIVNNEAHIREVQTESRHGWIYGITMPLAAMLFLFIGMTRNTWHPTWIVFPVAALITSAIVRIRQDRS